LPPTEPCQEQEKLDKTFNKTMMEASLQSKPTPRLTKYLATLPNTQTEAVKFYRNGPPWLNK